MFRRLAAWTPIAGVGAWLLREATHVHAHVLAPQTLIYCALPIVALCAWQWWRR